MNAIGAITTDHVKVYATDNGIAVLQLDRLEKRNAFNQSMIDAMVAALRHLDQRDEVRALVVAGGADGPFCGM